MTYKCCSLKLFWFFFSNFFIQPPASPELTDPCLLQECENWASGPCPSWHLCPSCCRGTDLLPHSHCAIWIHRASSPRLATQRANWLFEIFHTFSFLCQSFWVDLLRSAMWVWGWPPLYYWLGMRRGDKEIKNFNSCLAQQSIGEDKESTEFIKQIWITCGSWRQTNPVIKEACINYTRVP